METIIVVTKKIRGIRAIRRDNRCQKPSFTTVGAVAMETRGAPETFLEVPDTLLAEVDSRLGAAAEPSDFRVDETESLVMDNLDATGGFSSSLSESKSDPT